MAAVSTKKKHVNFVVCLRTSDKYNFTHALKTFAMVKRCFTVPIRFICISDDEKVLGYYKSTTNWPGWWVMTESFRAQGPTIVTGLDTLLISNLDCLANLALDCPSNVIYMMRPFNDKRRADGGWASGFMIWNGDWSWIYTSFDYSKHSKEFQGEQDYTSYRVTNKDGVEVRALQDYVDGNILSYRRSDLKNAEELPDNTLAVLFHGNPTIETAKNDWAVSRYHYDDLKEKIKAENISPIKNVKATNKNKKSKSNDIEIDERPILITGCARSGTSLVGGIINLSGAFGGIMSGPNANNKKGMFENSSIRQMVKNWLSSKGYDKLCQKVDLLIDPDNMEQWSDLKDSIREILLKENYKGGQWFYKGAKMCHMWRIWDIAFPHAKWVVVRRPDCDIIDSCLRTPFMRAYKNKAGWQSWVDIHKKRFEDMQKSNLDVTEIWPIKFINDNNYSEIKSLVKSVDLSWNDELVKDFVSSDLYHAKG